jgi:hypothetical protein
MDEKRSAIDLRSIDTLLRGKPRACDWITHAWLCLAALCDGIQRHTDILAVSVRQRLIGKIGLTNGLAVCQSNHPSDLFSEEQSKRVYKKG